MPTQADNTDTLERDNSKPAEIQGEKRLDRAAGEAAEKAEKTERRYDRDHSIFTQ